MRDFLHFRGNMLTPQMLIRTLRRRSRVWGLIILMLLIPVMIFLLHDDVERCHHYVSYKETFKNCSGCNSVAHIPFIINQPQLCATAINQSIDVIFVVFSRPIDSETRQVIRKTWASASRNNTSNFRHVFLLGTSAEPSVSLALRVESQIYGDVILSGFHDSYRNLTLKTMVALRWLSHYCSHARFFQKIDDDVWVYTKSLMPALNKHAPALDRGLGGHIRKGGHPERGPKTKWYISCKTYTDRLFPVYVHGPTYVGTLQLAQRLNAGCKDIPFINLEDVFMGLCQEFLGLKNTFVGPLSLWRKVNKVCEGKHENYAIVYRVTKTQMMMYFNAEPCPKAGETDHS
ncbi:hypothetical protein ACOMHN_024951 [Nucella lapillus]